MKQLSILIAAVIISFSSIGSANESFWKAVSEGRFEDARQILENDETVDVTWKPSVQSRSAASMVVDQNLGQVELLKRIASKKHGNANLIPHEEMRKYSNRYPTEEIKRRFPTGLESDAFGSLFIHWVCFEGPFELVEYYLGKLDVEALNSTVDLVGDTVLHYAINGKNDTALQYLLRRGARVDVRDLSLGETPLIRAAQQGRTAPLNILLAAKAAVNAVDFEGATALHWAALRGHTNVVAALLKARANPSLVSIPGTTALSNAQFSGHKKIVNLLTTAVAKRSGTKKRGVVAENRQGKKRVEAPQLEGDVVIGAPPPAGDDLNDQAQKFPRMSSPLLLDEESARDAAVPMDLGDDHEKLFDLAEADRVIVFNQEQALYQNVEDFLNANVRGRTTIRNAFGATHEVRVRATRADGQCGFTVLDTLRKTFTVAVVDFLERLERPDSGISPERAEWFRARIRHSMQNLNVDSIGAWISAYTRIQDNGHAAVWLDQNHLELLSFLFNYRITVYNVDLQDPSAFVEQEGGMIYEGAGPEAAAFHVAHVAVEAGAPLTHYERLELVGWPVHVVAPVPVVVRQDSASPPPPSPVEARTEEASIAPNVMAPPVNMQNLEAMFKQFVGELGPQAAWALLLGFQMGKNLK